MECKKGVVQHKYTAEEIEFLRENYSEYSVKELTVLFNKQFNLNVTETAIKTTLTRNKIYSGRTGQWQKGHKPFNKGLKWDDYMSKEGQANSRKTCFNSADRSINNSNHNEVPVGTEAIAKDGYIKVKIDNHIGTKDRRWWKFKHHIIYEKDFGPIPKGYNVIFADGNNRNFDKGNLILVSNAELALMNKNKLYYKGCAEATKCGAVIAKIQMKEKDLNKKGQ